MEQEAALSHNNHKHFSRRNFLNILGAATSIPLWQSPAQILIQSIMNGAAQSAAAAVTGVKPRRLLHILHEGAPPRWTFDLFLNPYDPTIVANGNVGTVYGGGSTASGVVYKTVSKKGINVPHLWQFNVPSASGGVRPMDELLNNMLLVRGINVGNPDHGAAQQLQFLPLGASQSTSALSADHSDVPFASVNGSVTQFAFKSLNSKSAVTIPRSGNMLSSLLSPFIRKDLGGFSLKRKEMGAALDASISILNTAADSRHPSAASISNANSAAQELLSQGFGDLNSIWTNLVAKYNLLISGAVNPSQKLPGINDRIIPGAATKNYSLGSETNLVTDPDLRTMVTSSMNIGHMATHFAMAEYILLNDLSYSVSIGPQGINNLMANGVKQSHGADEHTTGNMVSLILNSYMNLAYAACLLELISQLKAKSIFNETVIVMNGEFGRNARNDGTGSDHGFVGSSSAIYSGAISGPIVLGNIYQSRKQSANGIDTGTWGYGAPVAELGKPIDLGHWMSTLATLLRVPSPITAGEPLIMDTGTEIKSLVEKAKQV